MLEINSSIIYYDRAIITDNQVINNRSAIVVLDKMDNNAVDKHCLPPK